MTSEKPHRPFLQSCSSLLQLCRYTEPDKQLTPPWAKPTPRSRKRPAPDPAPEKEAQNKRARRRTETAPESKPNAIMDAIPAKSHYPPVSPEIMDMDDSNPQSQARSHFLRHLPVNGNPQSTVMPKSTQARSATISTSKEPETVTRPQTRSQTRVATNTPSEDKLGTRYPSPLSDELECAVCLSSLPRASFPATPLVPTCAHSPSVCLPCIALSIKTDLSTKRWDQLACPKCPSLLTYAEIREYADRADFERYEKFSMNALLSSDPSFR